MKLFHSWLNLVFPKGRPWRWVLLVLLGLVVMIVQWRASGWADRLEAWTIDARFRLRGAQPVQSPIIIVALDEASFQMMGNLQGENIRAWKRGNWAELVRKIAAGRPRLIALDVVFDTPGWDAGGDEALAQEMRQAGNLVLAGHVERLSQAGYATYTYSPPVEQLASVAAGVGVTNLVADVDGAIRRAALLWPWGGQGSSASPKDEQVNSANLIPSFGLVVATLYNRAPINVKQADLGDDLSLYIHYRGPEATFRTVPMYQVWSGELPAETFKDAIVLVGYTTLLEQDRHLAPFAGTRKMPGVEIHANLIDTLLKGDWLRRPMGWSPLVVVAGMLLCGVVLVNLPSAGLGLSLFFAGLLVYLGTGVLLFTRNDFLLPLAAPVIALTLVMGAGTIERLVFAERDKRLLRRRFAGIMSPERLQAVLDNWEALLDPQRPEKEAAVLFADIRGFTHATETLMRQNRSHEMVRFLNAYLDAMAQAVFLEGGVVYRTFGDGLLILFGVPEPLPDHGKRAVKAALLMAGATRHLQELWPLRAEAAFQMGIGVNDGPMVDAIVGRGRRFDYTVLGDPVNTAARIEAHCKVAMDLPRPPGGQVPETVTILISHDLYQKLAPQLLVDKSVPPFEARGKTEPVRVVRLLGWLDNG